MLAAAYTDDGEPVDVDAAAEAAALAGADEVAEGAADAAEAAEPSPFDDGFVRTFVRTSVHVRRFFPYYLGAALWLAVMLLMAPADRDDADLAGARLPETANLSPAGEFAADAAVSPSPAFGDIGATPADATFSMEFSSDTSFSSGADLDSSATFSDMTTFDTSGFSSDTSTLTFADEPEPLRIIKSGYSSRTGGTPLEQAPPGNGLPVAAVGGEATKRSFIALSGDETVLKLKLIEDPSNVGVEQATVRACPIVTDGWQAARGMAMDAEPAWAEPCVDATRDAEGVWTFDLSSFGKPGSAPGFALTPGTAAGLSFNLTFDPSPARGA